MIKNRSLGVVILLSLFTFGIYPIVLFCKGGKEVNMICEGDGKNNMHYLLAGLLGIVTLGIYPIVWACKAMNRLQDNAYRYGPSVHVPNSGGSFVLWTYLGSFIGVGPIVAIYKFAEDLNCFAGVYGNIAPLPYTTNQVERIALAQNNQFVPNFAPNGQPQQMPPAPAQPQLAAQPAAPAPQIPQNVQQPPQPQYKPHNQMPPQPEPTVQTPPPEVDGVPPTSPARGYSPVNLSGTVTGVAGMYADFPFPILDGEELTIGTNAAASNIVIDINGKYVSSRHVTIKYNAANNTYVVTDTSTNGTFTEDNVKLQKNTPKLLSAGQVIYLGTRENGFRLG